MKKKFGLSIPQVNLAADVLAGMFPGGLGVRSDELYTASDALRAAATACELAAILHEKDGREVLLKTACRKLYLSASKQDAVGTNGTQELIAKLFDQVGVKLVDPIDNRRDAWEPKLVASNCNEEESEILQDKELVLSLKDGVEETQNEDFTVLDGEPEMDDHPEICSECGKQHSICGYQPGYQECDGFSLKDRA